MQSFGAFFNDNKALAIALIVVAAIIALVALIFVYRFLFGRRLHMSNGGRTRQPRLGVVDAFDLDRQRQLVLVRRDNVEHLIMIGGPNDIVIESAFVRAQPNVSVSLGRDKDGPPIQVAPMAPIPATITDAAPPPPAASPPAAPIVSATEPLAPQPLPAPSSEPNLPLPVSMDVAEPVSFRGLAPLAESPAPGPVSPSRPEILPADIGPAASVVPAEPASLPLTRPAVSSLPRPTPPATRPTPSVLPPRPPLSSFRTPVQASSLPRPPAAGPRPTPLTSLGRGTSAASLRRDPAPSGGAGTQGTPSDPAASSDEGKGEATPPIDNGSRDGAQPRPQDGPPAAGSASGMAAAPHPQPSPLADPRPTPTIPTTLDTLESLEEEMAKLLGRPVAGSDKR